jgi:hypothetical protein
VTTGKIEETTPFLTRLRHQAAKAIESTMHAMCTGVNAVL